MPADSREFLRQCLLLDIETNEKNSVYAIGAVFRDQKFQIKSGGKIQASQLADLDAFGSGAAFLLGHNILGHDLPRLKGLAPGLKILGKPTVDTLYLSPLAFPANPYHRLVKDYQLVRDSMNDPVRDALLAGRVFAEQWDALAGQLAVEPDAPILYRGFLNHAADLTGTAAALAAMGIPLLEGDDLIEAFSWLARRYACHPAVLNIADQLADGTLARPPLAYVTAWLTVAGGQSVVPPWVRRRFAEVPALLHQLRETGCGDSWCPYCREHHDPQVSLKNYYGFEAFREKPATEDGRSLQKEIVAAAARNATLFATLPTGGGKSLCYLLPAIMRYQRRNMLTIVISPLQALMKDQVDNFERQTGTRIAAALNGMLTLPERGEVMEAVRMGDVGILFVSPEQLRNRSFITAIGQREIGAWVFDEAHCLSKWGHDFRPDYLYSIRFIREFAQKEKTPIPPVQCFTATAKRDVKAEIVDIIQRELGLRVNLFEGGHARDNLHYEVWPVDRREKNRTILELLRERYQADGSVVIYCATRKHTENLAEFLQNAGFSAQAFHAGIDPSVKKRIQDDFIAGSSPVICATNAFGMGIDKEDVRLVIHADIPGSLENYLQEAGRAGRDRKSAECILIFDERDIEGQFHLSSRSRLTQKEISRFLLGIKYAAKGRDSVVLTAFELLRLDVVDIDPDEHPDADTRVRTAVSWLERSGFLERNENNTRVFQGRPLVRDLDEAAAKVAALNLSPRQQKRWLAILAKLMQRRPNQAFSADELAGLASFAAAGNDPPAESETQRVIRTLNDMAAQGLMTKGTVLSAFIRYKVKNETEKHLQQVAGLERDFLQVLQESAPDMEVGSPVELDLRQVNQMLLDKGHEQSSPQSLKLILYGLCRDGKGLAAGNRGSIAVKARGKNRFTFRLNRDWDSLVNTVHIRQLAARTALRTISGLVPSDAKANASLLVEFTLEQIVDALKQDLLLLPQLKDPFAAAERALTAMHEQGVINLQQGLAVFRQAMTLHLHPHAKNKRYSKADYSPLKTHYLERNFQIHVMNEYARKALEKLGANLSLVASYFNDDKEDFVRRFFPGREKFLERATSEQSYLRIVDDLHNPEQEEIVCADSEKNMLVLAGPGAGKTRVVAHRLAFLLRVKRIRPKAILVLCFNRSAITALRKRVKDLVGSDMSGVTMLTFHGLALRLLGRSLVSTGRRQGAEETDFSSVIRDAVTLLKGEAETMGPNDVPARYALLGAFSHLLVDEYQDIDADQYELVALLAGRTLADKEQKLTILAVGDDDQNIYRFRGASVEFIRRFHQDYSAEIHYLTENYRSTAHIIAASNALIAQNTDRMKTGFPIRVNRARNTLPPGGNWERADPLLQGKVQVLHVAGPYDQASALLGEIRRLQTLGTDFSVARCAVLAREWRDLAPVRSVLEAAAIPVSLNWGRDSGFPRLSRIRENATLLDYLRKRRMEMETAGSLLALLPADAEGDTCWQANLRRLLTEWQEETGDALQPVSAIEDYLYEVMTEQGRAKSIASGLFLSTVHSVKGLEFDHVFILGDSWQERQAQQMEEERRLYYVGMSRARETLHLFTLGDRRNPHADLPEGVYATIRDIAPQADPAPCWRRYELLGLEDLFLDFAGMRPENHPVRATLRRLQAGDQLRVEIRKDHLELAGPDGISVARLSRAAQARWQGRLEEIMQIRVVALARRYREDSTVQEYGQRCHGEMWELPIVEFVLEASK